MHSPTTFRRRNANRVLLLCKCLRKRQKWSVGAEGSSFDPLFPASIGSGSTVGSTVCANRSFGRVLENFEQLFGVDDAEA